MGRGGNKRDAGEGGRCVGYKRGGWKRRGIEEVKRRRLEEEGKEGEWKRRGWPGEEEWEGGGDMTLS